MLETHDTVMVFVDIQDKLARLMHARESLFNTLVKLAGAMQVLGVPIILMEQIPEKLGETIAPLKNALAPIKPMPKKTFSCMGNPEFVNALKETGRRTVVLSGIETHVCIYQTAVDLINDGYAVEVVCDAVSSRRESDHNTALSRIRAAGAGITTFESLIFELARTPESPAFKRLLEIIR